MSSARRHERAAQPAVERDVGDEPDEVDENLRGETGADGDERGERGDDDRALIDGLILGGSAQSVSGRMRPLVG